MNMKKIFGRMYGLLMLFLFIVVMGAFLVTLRSIGNDATGSNSYPGPQPQQQEVDSYPSLPISQEASVLSDPSPLPAFVEEPRISQQLPTALPDRGVRVNRFTKIDLPEITVSGHELHIDRLYAPDLDGNLLVAKAIVQDDVFVAVINLELGTIEHLVPIKPRDAEGPYIDGNYVVWTELAPDSPTNIKQIQLLDIKTGRVHSLLQGNLHQLDIKGNILLWQELRNQGWEIYGYNLATDQPITVAQGDGIFGWPRVCSQNWLVYMYFPHEPEPNQIGSADLVAYNLETGEKFEVGQVPLSTSPTTGRSHDCDGERIAWASYNLDMESGQSLAQQHVYDLTTRSERIIDIPIEGWGIHVRLDGDILLSTVGYDLSRNVPFSVFAEDIPLELRGNVMVSGNRLAWITTPQDPQKEEWRLYTTEIIREP